MTKNMTEPEYYSTPPYDFGKAWLIEMGIPAGLLEESCSKTINFLDRSEEQDWDFWGLSAIKYFWRLGKKGTPYDWYSDFMKALDCLMKAGILTEKIPVRDITQGFFLPGDPATPIDLEYSTKTATMLWGAQYNQYLKNRVTLGIVKDIPSLTIEQDELGYWFWAENCYDSSDTGDCFIDAATALSHYIKTMIKHYYDLLAEDDEDDDDEDAENDLNIF